MPDLSCRYPNSPRSPSREDAPQDGDDADGVNFPPKVNSSIVKKQHGSKSSDDNIHFRTKVLHSRRQEMDCVPKNCEQIDPFWAVERSS